MSKKSKSLKYDDPTAFYRKLPPVIEVTDGSLTSPMQAFAKTRYYRCRDYAVTVSEADETMAGPPYLMTIRRKNHYPEWDYVVWIRYHVLPDSVVMAMILPPLNDYINDEDSDFKNVFTFECVRWGLDPIPMCPDCTKALDIQKHGMFIADFHCPNCQRIETIDFRTWNEAHGNGFHGVQK
jgi:hypothetical protein